MDMTDSIQAKSDQKNAEDFLSGPQTFTIEKVTAGNADQPIDVHLVESPGKPYKPSKSMRRVMVAAWGKEASAYAGRHLTLYCDPTVKFGGMVVGGIKISHMSHIDKKASFNLTVTRGKKATHTVEPITGELPAAKAEPAEDMATREQIDNLVTALTNAGHTTKAAKSAAIADALGYKKGATELSAFEADTLIQIITENQEN